MNRDKQSVETIFLNAIRRGIFTIDQNGRIWRVGKLHNYGKLIALTPHRAEKDTNGRGYLRVWFMSGRHHYSCQAHRLVWKYFNGEIEDGLQINHKNGVKWDNRPDNLELVTPSENQLHAIHVLKTSMPAQGEKNGNAKINAVQVAKIRTRRKSGDGISVLAKEYGLSYTQVKRIILHQRWKHIA